LARSGLLFIPVFAKIKLSNVIKKSSVLVMAKIAKALGVVIEI